MASTSRPVHFIARNSCRIPFNHRPKASLISSSYSSNLYNTRNYASPPTRSPSSPTSSCLTRTTIATKEQSADIRRYHDGPSTTIDSSSRHTRKIDEQRLRSRWPTKTRRSTWSLIRSFSNGAPRRIENKKPKTEDSKSTNPSSTPPPPPPPPPPSQQQPQPAKTLPIKAPEILQKALSSATAPLTRHENIYTLPNILTFSRLLSAPAIGYLILTSQPVYALLLFIYAGLTDAIDGTIARRFNSQTVVGTIIDPMADKTLMTVTVVSLCVQGLLPLWLTVIILGRDVGLAISACYYRYISLPPPKTMARYWDFSLPSAEVRPTEISKINTLLQLLLVGNAMVLPVLPVHVVDAWNLLGVFEAWSGLVAATTVWSGLSYVFSKDAVKILGKE